VTIDFDDLAGLQACLRHPAHEKLDARFGESVSSGLVYDFEVGLVDDLTSRWRVRRGCRSRAVQVDWWAGIHTPGW
jgi:Stress responsive A/B Barrel Domain